MSADRFPADASPAEPPKQATPPAQRKPISRQVSRVVPDAKLQAALSEVRVLPPPSPGPSPARIEAAELEALAKIREGKMLLMAAEAILLATVRR